MFYLVLAIVFFLIPSIVTAILKAFGITLGAIPTLILYCVFWWAAKRFYNLYSVERAKRKNLKGYRRSEPDPNQLCFEYDGSFYPYSDFLFSQTLARLKLSKSTLEKEIQISFDLKKNDSLIELEYYAASVALVLKENRKNSYEYVRAMTKWVVENKCELDLSSNPSQTFEKLNKIAL